MKNLVLTATLIASISSSSFAGGLGDIITEMAPPEPAEVEVAPASSSLLGWVIPVAVIAAIALILGASDNEEEPCDDC